MGVIFVKKTKAWKMRKLPPRKNFHVYSINFTKRTFKAWVSFKCKCIIVITRCPLFIVNFSHFSTSPLKPLNRIQWNLTGSKISLSFTKFVFFRPFRKSRWPPWPLIGWDSFDFSSETLVMNIIQQNLTGSKISKSSTKFVLLGPSESQVGSPASDWLRHFQLLLWNCWT